MRVTCNQDLKFSLSPESCVFSEAPQVSSEASKKNIVSYLEYECEPRITKKNDDSISLFNFMDKGKFPSGRTNTIQWFQCYRKI